jgi:hypothetical protein
MSLGIFHQEYRRNSGTTKEIAAVSGHRSLSEIERYTSRADQGRLATAAIAKLPDENKT